MYDRIPNTPAAQKMKFSFKGFFSKCNQIRSFLWIWSHLLKKSLMKNFIFCSVRKRNFQFILLFLQVDTQHANNRKKRTAVPEKCPYLEFFLSAVFAFGLNTERFRIQSECGKVHARKIPNLDTFHAVLLKIIDTDFSRNISSVVLSVLKLYNKDTKKTSLLSTTS